MEDTSEYSCVIMDKKYTGKLNVLGQFGDQLILVIT